ncbi:hypothetical protein LPB67_03995 [Undibacterium sp. Jales W-56]|uniref:hypothetical protein n=1 Tax=Undibacterium sp. Jales W-56 TaxID=2897325 RepID=UPI0021D1ABD0|nr:hypothetical protein [Undibacterium sp. Jales W-56]MCU6432937.1 hypothetical protein [Undibacterium sp. Jales W-56]
MTSFIRYSLAVVAIGLCLGAFLLSRETEDPSAKLRATTGKMQDAGSRPSRALYGSISPFGLGEPVMGNDETISHELKSAAIYGRNGRQVDFGGLTAFDYISKWTGLARAGSVEAAYNVYQAESVCANNDEAIAEYDSVADRDQFLNERKKLSKLCEGVTPVQVQERLHFLGIAARSGKVDAQIDYFMEGPYGRPIDLKENRDDPIVQKWKDDAITGLKSAASQGEPFALALLSQSYDIGELVPRDAKLSLSYKVAEAEARNTVWSDVQLRRKFGAQMSDADFENALQMGRQIARDCCKK